MLDKESSLLTCFSTPFGTFKWLRLPMGVRSASAIYGRKIQDIMTGIKGLIQIADDFLIYGKGDTFEAAQLDHDRNLKAFLDRCRERSVKLNKSKMKINTTNVRWIGHILTNPVMGTKLKKCS